MIEEGTKVLLVDSDGKRFILTAANRMLEVSRLGVIDGAAICNSTFGDRMKVGAREFVLVKPSIRDLLGMMERRAQIMTPKDSFVVPLYLDINSGSRVIEGGVGSGALTLVLLKAVAPAGKVYSYDNREEHASIARKNVALSSHSLCWEMKIADICTANLEPEVDAAVLDIPNPWDALDNVVRAVRFGGHVCCYIPNANQLERTVQHMRKVGLSDITAFETLQREMVVHEGGVRPSFDMLGHTGYLAFGRVMSSSRP